MRTNSLGGVSPTKPSKDFSVTDDDDEVESVSVGEEEEEEENEEENSDADSDSEVSLDLREASDVHEEDEEEEDEEEEEENDGDSNKDKEDPSKLLMDIDFALVESIKQNEINLTPKEDEMIRELFNISKGTIAAVTALPQEDEDEEKSKYETKMLSHPGAFQFAKSLKKPPVCLLYLQCCRAMLELATAFCTPIEVKNGDTKAAEEELQAFVESIAKKNSPIAEHLKNIMALLEKLQEEEPVKENAKRENSKFEQFVLDEMVVLLWRRSLRLYEAVPDGNLHKQLTTMRDNLKSIVIATSQAQKPVNATQFHRLINRMLFKRLLECSDRSFSSAAPPPPSSSSSKPKTATKKQQSPKQQQQVAADTGSVPPPPPPPLPPQDVIHGILKKRVRFDDDADYEEEEEEEDVSHEKNKRKKTSSSSSTNSSTNTDSNICSRLLRLRHWMDLLAISTVSEMVQSTLQCLKDDGWASQEDLRCLALLWGRLGRYDLCLILQKMELLSIPTIISIHSALVDQQNDTLSDALKEYLAASFKLVPYETIRNQIAFWGTLQMYNAQHKEPRWLDYLRLLLETYTPSMTLRDLQDVFPAFVGSSASIIGTFFANVKQHHQ